VIVAEKMKMITGLVSRVVIMELAKVMRQTLIPLSATAYTAVEKCSKKMVFGGITPKKIYL
jgi:hypothetical protein